MLMVNGEIYNHRELKSRLKEPHQFRTKSDSEVILHLYEEKGEDFVNDLNGMFAVVLYNRSPLASRLQIVLQPRSLRNWGWLQILGLVMGLVLVVCKD